MNFSGKSVLVTGATGTIGSEITRQLLKTDATDIVVFSRDEHKQYELRQELKDLRLRFIIGDIRDAQRVNEAFRGVNYCFHAAALKHVPVCEAHPMEAVKTNVIGSQNVISAAISSNLDKLLGISTDKAVEPTSALGASKLLMERLITAATTKNTKLASIRFGNIINSRGSVLPLWAKQAQRGGPVTITDENATRYFISLDRAVDAALKAMAYMEGGEVFIARTGRPERILDLAQGIAGEAPIKITGLRPGERLHEALMTRDEAKRARLENGMMVIA